MSGAQMIVVANGERAGTATLDLRGQARVEYSARPGYLRVEMHGNDGVPLAIANPVYLGRP
jgi:hypothetical protein